MEVFVILLAIGLSSSEKLDRGYLPPSGAKLAGGSSGDLQTPLEYPNENPTSGDKGYQKFEERKLNAGGNTINHDSFFKSGSKDDEELISIVTENSSSYTQTTVFPRNGFDTVPTEIPEMNAGIQNHVSDNRYPQKGISILRGTESFGNGYHYGKPEKMPIITAERIMNNYKSNAFGVYGGNTMIIKSYPDSQANLNNIFVEPNGIFDYPSNDLYKSDEMRRGSRNNTSISSLNPNISETKTKTSTMNSMETVKSLNYNSRNKVNNTFHKRPQRPQAESDRTAAILNYKNIIAPESYEYNFDTSNGIHMDETATTSDGVKASGSYSYTGDDGKVYSVIYMADENGFQPKGDHLPTPPPIPEAIQKVIEQAKIDKEAGISDDGSYDEEKYGHMKYQGPYDRYLQNMQVSHKSRNRDKGFRKIERKPILTVPKDADKNRINGKNVLNINNNVFQQPDNNLNGKFGMRKDMFIKKRNQKASNDINLQKSIDFRRHMIPQNPRNNIKQVISESSAKKHEHEKNTIQNNDHINFVRNELIKTHNHYQGINSGKEVHQYKDPGYYYVPPRQTFVEGRLQDTPSDIKTLNEFGTFYEDFKGESIPASQFYYIDQRNNKNNVRPKNPFNTTSNLTTEEPELSSHTYESNFYDSTNHDKDEAKSSEATASIFKDESITVVTTPKLYGNTLKTDAYDQENTKDYQEETVFPEQRDENEDTFEQKDGDLINLSTTPMPSETIYPSVLSDSIQFKAFIPSKGFDTTEYANKYPEGDGYFITKPDVQISFEDFPSSTYSPITVNKIKTETTPNIKVDGFGRPIQDGQQFYGKTTYFEYTETPFIIRADDMPKTTASFYNFEEPLDRVELPVDDKIVKFNLDYSEQERTENMDTGSTDKIIGEDFSGPKQPQRYDPSSGYFY